MMLAGCQTAGEPVQTGNDRYRMNLWGSDEAGSLQAQAFCRKSGFAWAEVTSSAGGVMEFACLRERELPAGSRSSTVECLPGLMVVDPTVCPNH